MSQSIVINVPIEFPLSDGRELVTGPLTYCTDGLMTTHNADFMRDPHFQQAYRALCVDSGQGEIHLEWRVHTIVWAATYALKLEGDFVEFGVNTGGFARAICAYTDLGRRTDRKMYLFDTFEGIPQDQFTTTELGNGLAKYFTLFGDTYESVRRAMEPFPNVELVRGRVPATLEHLTTTKVAYVSIDMNAVAPEMAAAEAIWDRLVHGAIIVLDDYGFPEHIEQKYAFDDFCRRKRVEVLTLPTGQGLILKP